MRMSSLLFFITLLLFPHFISLDMVSGVKQVPIGIFVYVWYGDGWGQRHWNDGPYGPVVDKPLDGYYSSLNYTYWLKTFQLISDAGFDFICLSYWGNNSYEHNATKIAVQALNDSESPLKFCILYEPFNETGKPSSPYGGLLYDYRNYTITNNVIYNNFVVPYRSNYFEFQGKPLLLSFNPAYPPKDDPRFTTRWLGHPPNPVDWIFWSHPLVIKNGCASVIPRLDNRFLPNGSLALDVDMKHGLYERQIDTIIREYGKNPDSIDVILFYGWNEYHERTEIEPHIDYNGVPSTYTYNATKRYIELMRNVSRGIPPIDPFSLGMYYLTEIQFVDSLALCKESQANPTTVWLANDNIYAYYLLNRNGSPLANSIREKLDEYDCWSNGKAELVLNKTIDRFRSSTFYNRSMKEGYEIKVEKLDGAIMEDFEDHSDLCFWWSYNMLLQKNVSGAVCWWDKGFSFYNGTGFVDKSFIENGYIHFDTYKLGLCLWSAYQINYTMNGEFHRDGLKKIEADMWRMQSPTLGGFYTGYNKNFDPDGTYTNTETTCLCLIPYTVPSPTPRVTDQRIYFIALAAIVLFIFAGYACLHRKRGHRMASDQSCREHDEASLHHLAPR